MILGKNRDQVARALAAAAIPSAEKAAAGGVATLGLDGYIPSAQIPPGVGLPTDAEGHRYIGASPSQTGLVVQTNTNQDAGAWASVNYSGAFTMYPGVSAGNTCYFGVDNKADMAAIIANVTNAQVLGTGSVVPEFWYGGGWAQWEISAVRHATPFTYYANSPFNAVEKQDIRLSDGFYGMTSSTPRTLNGITKYWIRFRIATAITTAPIINGLWVIGSATMFSTLGEPFYFGAARPVQIVQGIFTSYQTRYINGAAPGSASQSYASATVNNLVLQSGNNSLSDANADALGYSFQWLDGYDGSNGVTVRLAWSPNNANAGNIEIRINQSQVIDGDILTTGSRAATTNTRILAAPGVARQRGTLTWADLKAASLAPNGSWVAAIERDAQIGNANDTYAGNVEIEALAITVRRWRG